MTHSKILVICLGGARQLTRGAPGENLEIDGQPQV